ncbi:MAG: T9SS type A sorting domain-containing protein [Cyclobacteriaceae bacterium]|nr:T9SS type A sorting domain-containing protein [Cyclobacteriaceae bacterium]
MRKLILLFFLFIASVVSAQDLIVTNVNFDENYYRYGKITGTATIKNQGIIATNKTFTRLKIATDSLTDESYLDGEWVPELAQDEEFVIQFERSLDEPEGDYILIVEIDYNEPSDETNVDNNRFIGPAITILPSDVDFEITTLSTSATATELGSFNINYSMVNHGSLSDITGEGVYMTLFFSEDEILDTTDIKVGIDVIYMDSNPASGSETLALSPEISAGFYYPILVADTINSHDYFDETNELNNFRVGAQVEVLPSDISLFINYLDFFWYDTFHQDINVSVANSGTTTVYNYLIKYYISENDTLDTNDLEIWETRYPWNGSVIGGGSVDLYETLFDAFWQYPAPGDYYLIAGYMDSTSGFPLIEPVAIPFTVPEYNLEFDIDSIWINEPIYAGDDKFELNYNITNNTGDYITLLDVFFGYEIKNADNQVVYKEDYDYDIIYLSDGETETKTVNINLDKPLKGGVYSVTVSYSDAWSGLGIYKSLTQEIEVLDSIYLIESEILGNEGEVISSGQAFLYRDLGMDTLWVRDTTISLVKDKGYAAFSNGEDNYTVYVVPDHDLYPNYIPTILGDTYKLTETSFATINSDTLFQIRPIYVPPLDSMGTNSVSGQVVSNSSSGGRVQGDQDGQEGVWVYLVDENGTVIDFALTDSSGNYSFTNLADGEYSVYIDDGELLLQNDIEVEVDLENGIDEINLVSDFESPDDQGIEVFDYDFTIDSLRVHTLTSNDTIVNVDVFIHGNEISDISEMITNFEFHFSASSLEKDIYEPRMVNLMVGEQSKLSFSLRKPEWIDSDEEYILQTTYLTDYTDGTQSSKSEIFWIDIISGLDDSQRDQISIYPNPITSYINVVTDNEIEEVKLFNALGQSIEVTLKVKNNCQVSVIPKVELVKGCYFLEVVTKNTRNKLRVVK